MLGIFWYYYSPTGQVNYLIPGVPYNGIYNLFFRNSDSLAMSSVLDILGYWGDNRFSTSQIREKLIQPNASSSLAYFAQYQLLDTTLNIKNFFDANGYETYRWASSDLGNEIEEIKKFVNPQKKTPILVFQRRSLKIAEPISGLRVVIGVFDKDKKVIVHDHDLGNNYEISYKDFEAMFKPDARAILAVWPSDNLKASLKGPDLSVSYSQRTEAMNKTGDLLVEKGAVSVYYGIVNNPLKNIEILQKMIGDLNFKYFPPAFQVVELSVLANYYLRIDEPEKAIELINEHTLPLNHDLNKPFLGWVVLPVDKYVRPYFILSKAYLENNQRSLAITSYKEMVKWRDMFFKETGNKDYLGYKIPELEK